MKPPKNTRRGRIVAHLVQIDDLKRTEDSHEAVAGDGREGEHAGHHAHHSVERVQLAENSCKANLL